jgi:hypothetical protein
MKKIFLIFTALLCSVIFLIWIFQDRLNTYLSAAREADGNLLIIDGWMRLTTVENLKEELQKGKYEQILIAGMRSSDLDFCKVEMNGFLIFYPGIPKTPGQVKEEHTLKIVTKSKMGGIYRCHFNFYINDSIVGDFYSEGVENTSSITWMGSLNDIDSMMVQFTNDMFDDIGDRDLFVKEIRIDSTRILSYQHNSVLDFGRLGGGNRKSNDYDSHQQILRNELIASGIDSAKVAAIALDNKKFNRTLTTSLAVRDWINHNNLNINGINVASMGIHSRRTWLTYKTVLNSSCVVGNISLPDYRDSDSNKKKFLRTLTETLDYIYYNIILIPFRLNQI